MAEAVTNQPPDTDHLAPMLELVRRNTGELPKRLSADAGYMSEANVTVCQDQGVDAYLAVGRDKHGADGEAEGPRHESEVWHAMRHKLRTEQGRSVYARRKVIVEPVFGHTKHARHQGSIHCRLKRIVISYQTSTEVPSLVEGLKSQFRTASAAAW